MNGAMALGNNDIQGSYLGFELGTKKLKAVLLDSQLKTIATAGVDFDADLPEFNTVGGARSGPNPDEYYANPVMWIKGLDIVMERLRRGGVKFWTIAAISGSTQPHGSVYWSHSGVYKLKNLDATRYLHVQLNHAAFAVKQSPIWMDGSTGQQCAEMESAVGGAKEMVKITGSRCHARFTGPQIRKIFQQQQKAYTNTERISLVSSFLASIFIGDVAPIEFTDGSGMNLLNINKRRWSKTCMNACAPDLRNRLGVPVNSNDIVGDICAYFIRRFKFSRDCKVVAFTGENPSAFSGMLIRENWLVMSLGASDTLVMHLKKHPKLQQGHVLCHPTEPGEFLGFLCFVNASWIRDSFKREEANNDWDVFNKLLDLAPQGNNGNMALHFVYQESIPEAKGTLRWAKIHTERSIDAALGKPRFDAPETEIRALIEGQFIHKRAVLMDMGIHSGTKTNIVVTGEAAENLTILQVISDIFNAPVYTQKEKDAGLYGAAYRAKYAIYAQFCCGCPLPYTDYMNQYIPEPLEFACEPRKHSDKIYEPLLARYTELLKVLEERYKGIR